ncbi:MAG: SDR family NAD(P)-dependent oxidoreductase [Rubricella sp.]
MKTILITGCSSGIGYDAAKALSATGWRVLATCRAEEDCARLRGLGLESFRLDHADPESVRTGCSEAVARAGTLDAVFINGAFALPAMTEDLPRAGLESLYAANVFGPHQIVTELMPHFRERGAGRIVFNSSVLGFVALKCRAAYVSSKFALEGYADCLRMELAGSGIHVSLIEPGPIPTEIRRNAQKQFERWIDWRGSRHTAFYENELMPRLYDESGTPDRFERPPSAVTEKLRHAIEADRPRPRYYVTTVTHIAGVLRRILPTRALDAVLSRN